MRNRVFVVIRTVKTQTSQLGHKVWWGPLIYTYICYRRQWFKRTTKALIRLRTCAVWSRLSLSVYAQKISFPVARIIFYRDFISGKGRSWSDCTSTESDLSRYCPCTMYTIRTLFLWQDSFVWSDNIISNLFSKRR